jgi:hypothetical protein
MTGLLFAKCRVTEADDSLRIRLTWPCYALRVSYGITQLIGYGTGVCVCLYMALRGIGLANRAALGDRPPLSWTSPLLIGMGLYFLVAFGLGVINFGLLLPATILRGRDPIVIDRRSNRIAWGREDVGALDAVACVRFGPEHDEAFDVDGFLVSIEFAGGGRGPYPIGAFWGVDEAGAFARRVAGFVGVPVVGSKKAKAEGDLVALTDDALAGEPSRRGG